MREMFTDPKHPYAQALIGSLPSLENKGVFQGIPGPGAVAAAPAERLRLPSALRARHGRSAARSVPKLDGRWPAGGSVTCHLYWQRRCRQWHNCSNFRNVSKVYSRGPDQRRRRRSRCEDISLTLREDEPTILTVAGESGSGKTTLAMLLLGFIAPTTGQILYRGKDISTLRGEERMTSAARCRRCSRTPSRCSIRSTRSTTC